MNYFCTYFDRNYLPRGLALYRSLREHCSEFRLWVLCMDEATHEVLTQLKLPEVEPITLKDFERNDEPLLRAKQNRSQVEYYFTCTPSLPLYVLNNRTEVDLITYLDADLFFFADPAPLFAELGKGSVAIIGHRFPPHLRDRERYGIYNVGWLSFRRDEHALACLNWWREQCITWCYDREEEGRFADQKYLDDWPIRFSNVVVLENKGANVAPWNISNYHLGCQNGNTVMVSDNQPLIFFHFHVLKKITSWWYHPGWESYGVTPSMLLRRRVYAPYIKALLDVSEHMLPKSATHPLSGHRRNEINQRKKKISLIRYVVGQFRMLFSVFRAILTWKYILVINGHVI